MMNALREWIASTIVADLNAVLDDLQSISSQSSQPRDIPIYNDDGSNVRIQPSKHGVVQITKVCTYFTNHPFPTSS